MLSELDETIRQVLVHAGGFDPAEVDVSFEIPNREWSGGISKPTLNCYLFDIHERRALREDGWSVEGRGSRNAARRHPPLFFEITYLITAWTRAVEDEHRLLWHVLQTLVRFPTLPPEHLQGALRAYDAPIPTTTAQLEGVLKSPGEFWTALENQLKPSLSFVVTLALERTARPAGLPVMSTGIRVSLPEAGADGFALADLYRLPQDFDPAGVMVTVVGRDTQITTDAAGRFALDLPPGRYALLVEIDGRARRREVIVRGPRAGAAPLHYGDTLLDQDGHPLVGIEVEAEALGLRTRTDQRGAFSLPLPPGRHTLLIFFDEWTQRREVLVRSPGYTLTLSLGGGAA